MTHLMSSGITEIQERHSTLNFSYDYENTTIEAVDEGMLKKQESYGEGLRNRSQIGRIEEICVKEEPVEEEEEDRHSNIEGMQGAAKKGALTSSLMKDPPNSQVPQGVKHQPPQDTSAPYINQYLNNFGLTHFLDVDLCRENSDKVKYLQCPECPYQTRLRQSLTTHIRTHTGEKPFKCAYCSFRAARRNNLTTHLRTHTGEKPFKCSECSFRSASGSDLKRHSRIHTGEKPYTCEICSYSAAQRSRLTAHYRTHTGLKPYKCELCSFTAAQRSHLTTHLRTHTGEKPFQCRVCPFTTAKSSHLRQHERIHTGEKPYECPVCPYRTARSSSLKRHLKTHSEDKKREEICVKTELEPSPALVVFEN